VWKSCDLPDSRLLPIGSCLFGSFRILDKHIGKPSDYSSSYVDYGFSSDDSNFAGCHRFQITRVAPEKLEGEATRLEPQVRIDLEHFRCNPQKNEPSKAGFIERFHFVYAKSLFANGMQLVLA
jgi:hypothetical protein